MNFKMVFPDPHCRYSRPTGGSGIIRLVNMSLNAVFLYLHCRYIACTGGAGLVIG